VRSEATWTSAEPTRRLRVYPTRVLGQPAIKTARSAAPAGRGPAAGRSPRRAAMAAGGPRTRTAARGDRFGSVFERAAPGPERAPAAPRWRSFGWGAVHALSPGHGKAMVAAYLVGRARHGAPRRRARRDGDRDPHDRRLRPGVVALALSVTCCPRTSTQAEPRLGLLVLGVGGLVRAARAPARTPAHHDHHHGPGTDTTTGTHHDPPPHGPRGPAPARRSGHGRVGRAHSLPVGARRAARRGGRSTESASG
jgi:hypothetical protein